MNSYAFSGKYVIKADLKCLTGLHIGGTDEGFEIGGLDNPVIKDPITGYPYIPGSSLKGKLRSLLEWAEKADSIIRKDRSGILVGVPCDCGGCDVCIIFGCSASIKEKEPTRLAVRDSFPKPATIEEWKALFSENIFTEIKTENAIDRLTSSANPRTMERVPAGSVFEVEMTYDLYKKDDKKRMQKLFEAMALLEDSFLGGGGSRGSGKVAFKDIEILFRSVDYYRGAAEEIAIDLNGASTVIELVKKFDSIFEDKT